MVQEVSVESGVFGGFDVGVDVGSGRGGGDEVELWVLV